MADTGFSFQQCSFLLEFQKLQIFCFIRILFYTDQNFYHDLYNLYGFWVKSNKLNGKNGASKKVNDASSFFDNKWRHRNIIAINIPNYF